MAMPDGSHVPRLDGRLARSRRTHEAIVDALFDLIQEGRLSPTTDEIAARAGVASRTIFQHFADRDRLNAELGLRQLALLQPLLDQLPAEGPLDERLDAVCAQRRAVYEVMTPLRRAALLVEPFSESARANVRNFRALKRADIERVFAAEIDECPVEEQDLLCAALGATASWSHWESLRAEQGLDADRAQAVLHHALRSLLTMARERAGA